MFVPFVLLSFIAPQSYIYFIKYAKMLEKTKTDYGTFMWFILPFILAPIGFILFINKCFKKN